MLETGHPKYGHKAGRLSPGPTIRRRGECDTCTTPLASRLAHLSGSLSYCAGSFQSLRIHTIVQQRTNSLCKLRATTNLAALSEPLNRHPHNLTTLAEFQTLCKMSWAGEAESQSCLNARTSAASAHTHVPKSLRACSR